MTPERWTSITDLFDSASQVPPAAREAWLEATGADDELRAEVRAMLEAYDTDPDYLEQPANPVAALEDTVTDALIGRRLGAWRLTRQLGRGGTFHWTSLAPQALVLSLNRGPGERPPP